MEGLSLFKRILLSPRWYHRELRSFRSRYPFALLNSDVIARQPIPMLGGLFPM